MLSKFCQHFYHKSTLELLPMLDFHHFIIFTSVFFLCVVERNSVTEPESRTVEVVSDCQDRTGSTLPSELLPHSTHANECVNINCNIPDKVYGTNDIFPNLNISSQSSLPDEKLLHSTLNINECVDVNCNILDEVNTNNVCPIPNIDPSNEKIATENKVLANTVGK